MTINYTQLQEHANALISAFGQPITIRSYSGGTYATATGAVTRSYSDSVTFAVVNKQRQTAPELTLKDHRYFLVAFTIQAKVGDTVIDRGSGLVYRVVGVHSLNPDGVVIYTELECIL
jgi:hypothetical protein